MSNQTLHSSQYYNPNCQIQTCTQDCCNFFKICPNSSSPSSYQNRCWYEYDTPVNMDNNTLTGGIIAAMTIGCAVFVGLVCLAVWCGVKKCRKQDGVQNVTKSNTNEMVSNAQIDQTNTKNLQLNQFNTPQPYYKINPEAQPYTNPYAQPYIHPQPNLQSYMHPQNYYQPYFQPNKINNDQKVKTKQNNLYNNNN